jgi:predicted DNA-binding antitoxin AbrB/MazE fold protein
MATTVHVVYDGSVLRPIDDIKLIPGKKYTITIDYEGDYEKNPELDPAFNIASLAVDTNIPDLAHEHDHYLYGTEKRVKNE